MNYSTKRRKDTRKRYTALLLAAVIMAGIGWMIGMAECKAVAEKATVKAWVLCQPADYINLRARASRKSTAVGRLDCGDAVELDGVTKNGFARVTGITIDSPDEAWIYTGFVVFDRPVWSGEQMEITGNGRVAARKNCCGEVRQWLQPGALVTVYWKSDEWCVTNRGFIKTQYLEVASV